METQESHSERIKRRRAEREARNRARRKQQIGCGCFCLVIFVFAFIVLLGIRSWQVVDNTRKIEETKKPAITINIPEGATLTDISNLLQEKEVIKSASRFKWYCRFKGAGKDFKSGDHNFVDNMEFKAIISELNNPGSGEVGVVKFLVREGLTIDQIAAEYEKITGKPAKEFIDAVSDKDFVKHLVEKYPSILSDVASKSDVRYTLEGYLFPATYDMRLSDGPKGLIEQMVYKTNEVLSPMIDDIKASKHSVNEIMTLASLVEKEGVTLDDREKIASVFYNRMAEGMPIQSDISILYALKEHKEIVSLKDLEVDSPYNLYKHKGLSPGPMNNPSKDAITASIHPANTDYLYFFANLKTGKVYFTKDFNQHLAWQKEYETTGNIKG